MKYPPPRKKKNQSRNETCAYAKTKQMPSLPLRQQLFYNQIPIFITFLEPNGNKKLFQTFVHFIQFFTLIQRRPGSRAQASWA